MEIALYYDGIYVLKSAKDFFYFFWDQSHPIKVILFHQTGLTILALLASRQKVANNKTGRGRTPCYVSLYLGARKRVKNVGVIARFRPRSLPYPYPQIYRGVNKGLHVLLSRTQAGPGKTVKQEQEEISRNHVYKHFPEAQYCKDSE